MPCPRNFRQPAFLCLRLLELAYITEFSVFRFISNSYIGRHGISPGTLTPKAQADGAKRVKNTVPTSNPFSRLRYCMLYVLYGTEISFRVISRCHWPSQAERVEKFARIISWWCIPSHRFLVSITSTEDVLNFHRLSNMRKGLGCLLRELVARNSKERLAIVRSP